MSRREAACDNAAYCGRGCGIIVGNDSNPPIDHFARPRFIELCSCTGASGEPQDIPYSLVVMSHDNRKTTDLTLLKSAVTEDGEDAAS